MPHQAAVSAAATARSRCAAARDGRDSPSGAVRRSHRLRPIIQTRLARASRHAGMVSTSSRGMWSRLPLIAPSPKVTTPEA